MHKTKGYCLATLLLLAVSPAHAATTYYTSQADFLSNLGAAPSTTYNFDAMTEGDIIADGDTLNGATFNYDFWAGVPITVNTGFDSTSLDNYLGTDVAGSGAFYGGDSITITFDQTMRAFGLYVISADIIFDDDFTITTSSGLSFSNSSLFDIQLSDGEAYYIGLIADAGLGFNSITFSSTSENYLFNIDDITVSAVPLPAAIWLMGSGLLCLAGLGRRTKLKS